MFSKSKFTIVLLLAIVGVGLYSYFMLPRESTPDIKVPLILVTAVVNGMHVEQSEKLLARPIEREMKSIPGIVRVISIVRDGIVSIALEFEHGSNMRTAIEEVHYKLSALRSELPRELISLTADEVNLGLLPILKIALVSDVMTRELSNVALKLRSKIEFLKGVHKVNISGLQDYVIELEFLPEVMNNYGIGIGDIQRAVGREYTFVEYGVLESNFGSHKVKISGSLDSHEKIRNLVLKSYGDRFITVGDVAKVKLVAKQTNELILIDGKPCVVLEISKNTDSDIALVTRQVMEVFKDVTLPQGMSLQILWNQSKEVRGILRELENTVIFSMLLVLAIMMIFMRVRTAILTALSVPISFLMAVIAIYFMGFTLNIVILFTMIMAVGMLVDDAIVINEYADRKMAYGMGKMDAYREAVYELFKPITASTAIRLVVYIPLLFWPGIVGEFIKYIPAVAISALVGSWVMATVFIPVVGAVFGRVDDKEQPKITTKDADISGLGKAACHYQRVLHIVLDHPRKFVYGIASTLLFSCVAYFTIGPGIEFFPDVDPDRAVVIVGGDNNLSMREKREIAEEIGARIRNVKGVRSFYVRCVNGVRAFANDGTIGEVHIEFTDWFTRDSSKKVLANVFSELEGMKGVVFDIQYENMKPNKGKKPLEFNLRSHSVSHLQEAADLLKSTMTKSQGFVGVHMDDFVAGTEWVINVDRKKAHSLGIDAGFIGQFLKMITDGLVVGKYYPTGYTDELDIVARFPEGYRTLTNMSNVMIGTPYGARRISSLIKKEAKHEISTVKRVNGVRALTISSYLAPGYLLSERVDYIKKVLREKVGHEVMVEFVGEMESQEESKVFLVKAFVVVLLLMILVLMWELNNFYYVFVIMTSVFLSTMCVFFGFLVTYKVFGVVMGGVGIVVLAGVAVNNNILLVDAFRINLANGCSLRDAAVKAALSRLRPIFLTVITGVLGLLPMVFKISIDFVSGKILYNSPSSQLWFELSSTISMGLLLSSGIMLLFTPAVLMLRAKSDRV